MPARRRNWHLTDGERHLLLALISMAMLGATVGLVVSARLGSGAFTQLTLQPFDLWMVLSGAAGAAVALWLMRHRMGLPGWSGLSHAVIGAVGMTFVAPLIAGTLTLPLYGTMFGPFTLIVTLVGAPGLAVLWVAILLLVHALMRVWVDERDSIFAAARP